MTEPDPDAVTPEGQACEPTAPAAPAQIARWRERALEADALEDRLKRAQAEFVNESRRIQRQAEQDRRFAVEGLVRELAHVVGSLDQALKVAGPEASTEALRQGVALVLGKTEDLLLRYGAEVLRPTGQTFDPAAHEAISMVDRDDLPAGSVAEVLSPGMRLNGRVVKPAQVTVVRASVAPATGA